MEKFVMEFDLKPQSNRAAKRLKQTHLLGTLHRDTKRHLGKLAQEAKLAKKFNLPNKD